MAAVISIVFIIILTPSFIPSVNSLDMIDNPTTNINDDIALNPTHPFDILEGSSGESGSSYNIEEYKESLNKIRKNYVEIQNEVKKLGEMKKDLEVEKNQNTKSKKQIELINNEIEELKDREKSSKKFNMFYSLFISGNMFALVLFFIFSKVYKLKKERSRDYGYI